MIAIILSAFIVILISLIITMIYYEEVIFEKNKLAILGSRIFDRMNYKLNKLNKKIVEKDRTINKLKVNIIELMKPSDDDTLPPLSKFVIEIHKSTNNEIYYIIKYKSNSKVYLRTSETYKNKSFLRRSAIEMAELLNCDLINKEN